jgi:hypothetical protein
MVYSLQHRLAKIEAKIKRRKARKSTIEQIFEQAQKKRGTKDYAAKCRWASDGNVADFEDDF